MIRSPAAVIVVIVVIVVVVVIIIIVIIVVAVIIIVMVVIVMVVVIVIAAAGKRVRHRAAAHGVGVFERGRRFATRGFMRRSQTLDSAAIGCSSPAPGILTARDGLDPEQLRQGFRAAVAGVLSQGNARRAKKQSGGQRIL